MTPNTSRISVIIPMFNAERTIASALASVLEQTCPADEILVVDNGSNDGSVRAADGFAPVLRVLHERNPGPAAARNLGAAFASGEFFAFLDADDRMPADRLAFQAHTLRANPDIGIVFGQEHLFRDGERPWEQPVSKVPSDRIRAAPLPGAMMCRRSVFEQLGRFAETLQAAEFIEWYARARDAGVLAVVPARVVQYRRVHAGNLTWNRQATHAGYALAIRQVLVRRRGG